MKRPKGYMKLPFFIDMMENNKNLKRVSLNVWGEPLLHKDIFKMVSIAKYAGAETVMFTTNGTLLTEARIKETIDSGLDILEISVDGSKKAYQNIRQTSR